mmetsp:Transcript_38553/g.103523  ORF Transcript_38553/g.103523 Transcript_38553/m.103523 type:complete len:229 (-) Transcript_38553:1447-2133(-)
MAKGREEEEEEEEAWRRYPLLAEAAVEKPCGTSLGRISRPHRSSSARVGPWPAAEPSGSRRVCASMPWKASSSLALRAISLFSSSGEVTSWPPASPPGPPSLPPESPSTARSAALRCSPVACLRNMPAPITFLSISSFSLQRASMCLSTFESVTKRTTRTSLVWPTRCTRATACLSFWGFQSMSKSTTVSAACRFRPRPPARADSRKTFTLSSELKRSMRAFLCSCAT